MSMTTRIRTTPALSTFLPWAHDPERNNKYLISLHVDDQEKVDSEHINDTLTCFFDCFSQLTSQNARADQRYRSCQSSSDPSD